MMNISDRIDTIKSKNDFVRFVELLLEDLKNNPEKWENKTLPQFLEAMTSWVEDMDGYYLNNNLPIPANVNWSVFANILAAAKIYE